MALEAPIREVPVLTRHDREPAYSMDPGLYGLGSWHSDYFQRQDAEEDRRETFPINLAANQAFAEAVQMRLRKGHSLDQISKDTVKATLDDVTGNALQSSH